MGPDEQHDLTGGGQGASEGRFRALAASAPVGMFQAGLDGNATYVNAKVCEFTGLPAEAHLGDGWIGSVHPDDRKRVRAEWSKTVQGKGPSSTEFRFVSRDNVVTWVSALAAPFRAPSGEVIGSIGTLADITKHKRVEAALRESEERFRQLAETVREVFYIYDRAAGRFLYMSPTYEDLWQEPVQKAYDDVMSFRRAVHPDDDARFSEAARKESEEGEYFNAEYRIVRPDGSVRWVRSRNFPILDENGAELRVVGLTEDVTEHKEAELALRESERKFRLMTEAIDDVFWISTPGVTEQIYVSPAYEKLWGRSLEEVLREKRSFIEAIHPDDRARYAAAIETEHAQGRAYTCEYRICRPDGTMRWISERGFPATDDEGQVTLMAGSCEDITERKLAEGALRESEKRFRLLFENSHDLITTADEKGTTLWANPAWHAVFGDDLADGGAPFTKIHPDDLERVTEAWQHLVSDGAEIRNIEYRFQDPGGEYLTFATSAYRAESSEGTLYCVIARDITGRRQLEEQLRQSQKMEAVGRLAGGVAHDFNNVLTAIIGFTEMIRDDLPSGSEARQNSEEVLKAGHRAAGLVRQLLAFSRRQVMRPMVMDLNGVVTEMRKMLARVIREDIELVTELGDKPSYVEADPGQIEQVILNLALNAGDAMPSGGRLVITTSTVDLGREPVPAVELSPGWYVKLSVSDTGCGMDHDAIVRIFEPFFTTKDKGHGTGLGLATVYGIVRQTGGDIAVESEVGAGTTFSVFLPLARSTELSADPVGPTASQFAGTETVLLVEDEDAVRKVTAQILCMQGYTVLEAGNGAEALDVWHEHSSDICLVLTDVIMPRVNGKELVDQLRSERPGLPVVYLSGHVDEALRRQIVLDRHTDFLQKPVTAVKLLKHVHGFLDRPPAADTETPRDE
jgi:PAS domain S-box-containing protein